jgi:hypothetical protein
MSTCCQTPSVTRGPSLAIARSFPRKWSRRSPVASRKRPISVVTSSRQRTVLSAISSFGRGATVFAGMSRFGATSQRCQSGRRSSVLSRTRDSSLQKFHRTGPSLRDSLARRCTSEGLASRSSSICQFKPIKSGQLQKIDHPIAVVGDRQLLAHSSIRRKAEFGVNPSPRKQSLVTLIAKTKLLQLQTFCPAFQSLTVHLSVTNSVREHEFTKKVS